eukprot:jgi/Chlat1/1269/Chrsp115S00760
MFEARMLEAALFKKVLDSFKDLVTEGNIDCSSTGISLQAMDTSHVALVAVSLKADGFDHFRCDRALSLGMNFGNLGKMLRCAQNTDVITLKAEDSADTCTIVIEGKDDDKIADFELKLMDIDSEHLGIPDQEYTATVTMPAQELQRICRDLASIADTVVISVSKDGIKFSANGDIGAANITVRQNAHPQNDADKTIISMQEPVALTFALRYLNNFTKATSLSPSVKLQMSAELPIVVEYVIGDKGHVRFYLAPKIEGDEAA